MEPGSITGEWIGLLKASTAGSLALQSAMAELSKRDDFDQLHLYDLLNHVIKQGHKIRVLYITGHWLDVDNLQDLAKAQAFN